MDHQEQHHQKHRTERAEEKRHEKQVEQRSDNQLRVIHPLWFLVLGTVLILAVVATWMLISGRFFAG